MRVVIEESGRIIPMNHLASCTLRTDLTPVPANFEMTVFKPDEETMNELKDGKTLIVGSNSLRMEIVKVLTLNTQIIVEDRRINAVSIIAVLAGCSSMIKPLGNAVIKDETNFAEAYRACGCKLKFSNDIPLLNFISAYGAIPTTEVANCLQRESAAIHLDLSKLSVKRLRKFFDQDPVLTLDPGAVAWINNPLIERQEALSYASTAEDGAIIQGNQSADTPIKYIANTDARCLKNMNEILITRGTATRPLNMDINAGDIFLINNVKHVVLTAAHVFKSGALGGGSVHASRYWLATMSS
jgi:hypothetical protein